MTKEQEEEVSTQVKFKMDELASAISNKIKISWQTAALSGSPKYTHYWEAFLEFQRMLQKERDMPPPRNDMSAHGERIKFNKAVDSLSELLIPRGKFHSREYDKRVSQIVQILSDFRY